MPLPRSVVISYGAVAGPFEMLRAPGLAILPALYSKEHGLALTTISLALLLLRLSDGATDLIVGVLSDRTRSKYGPRKPWLLASVPVAILAAWGLYIPGQSPSIWQFAGCYFAFYLAWTMFEIPYTAWSAELARSYEDRTRLALSRQVSTNLGLILLSLVPLLPFLSSTEMTFETLGVIFWIVAIVYPAGVLYALLRVPKGRFVPAQSGTGLREVLLAIRGNRPLHLFLGAAFASDLALGAGGAMFFLFFDTYLGIGTSFTLVFLTALGASTVSLKMWQFLVARTSKKRLLVTCMVGGVIWGMLIAVIEPGPWVLPIFVAYLALYYVLGVGREVALYAMIGDIVDYEEYRTGANRAGQFASAWMVLRKLAYATGPAIAFFVAGIAGYDPSAGSNDAQAVFGLKTANGYLPALLMLAAIFFAIPFPLTPRRQRAIRQRLERRAARELDA